MLNTLDSFVYQENDLFKVMMIMIFILKHADLLIVFSAKSWLDFDIQRRAWKGVLIGHLAQFMKMIIDPLRLLHMTNQVQQ